jgi:hypothetical protein
MRAGQREKAEAEKEGRRRRRRRRRRKRGEGGGATTAEFMEREMIYGTIVENKSHGSKDV